MGASLGLIKAAAAITALAVAGLAPASPATVAGPPTVSTVRLHEVTTNSATISAVVRTHSAPTTYEVLLEWAPECAPLGCEKPESERIIAHGTIGARKASKTLSIRARLEIPKWRYRVRVFATNEYGTNEGNANIRTR